MDHGGERGGLEAASMASACAGRVDLPTFPYIQRTFHFWTPGIQFTLFSTFSLSLLNLRGKHFLCHSLSWLSDNEERELRGFQCQDS